MMQALAYVALLFLALGSWAIPHLFSRWWGGDYAKGKSIGVWLMIAVDLGLGWFWFQYGSG